TRGHLGAPLARRDLHPLPREEHRVAQQPGGAVEDRPASLPDSARGKQRLTHPTLPLARLRRLSPQPPRADAGEPRANVAARPTSRSAHAERAQAVRASPARDPEGTTPTSP